MILAAKYQKLMGKGLDVKEDQGKLVLTFSDLQKFHQFLLIYDENDFSGRKFRVNSFGKCQGCDQIFMGGLTEELISLAAAQAREVAAQNGELILHLCPLCQLEAADGLQELCAEVEASKNRLLPISKKKRKRG